MYTAYLPKSNIAKTISMPHGDAFMLGSCNAICDKQPPIPFIKVSVIDVDLIKCGKRICTISIPATNGRAAKEYLEDLSAAERYYGFQYEMKQKDKHGAENAL